MNELSPAAAAQRLADDPDKHLLLDVRENNELMVASVAGATHIPMGEIEARIGEIDRAKVILCLCHHGGRSAMVAQFLATQGFTVYNVSGGINVWAQQVDPTIPVY